MVKRSIGGGGIKKFNNNKTDKTQFKKDIIAVNLKKR